MLTDQQKMLEKIRRKAEILVEYELKKDSKRIYNINDINNIIDDIKNINIIDNDIKNKCLVPKIKSILRYSRIPKYNFQQKLFIADNYFFYKVDEGVYLRSCFKKCNNNEYKIDENSFTFVDSIGRRIRKDIRPFYKYKISLSNDNIIHYISNEITNSKQININNLIEKRFSLDNICGFKDKNIDKHLFYH